jgi:hypothetical protein
MEFLMVSRFFGRWGRRGSAALVLPGLLAVAGCLFEPREPELPATGEEIDYIAQSSPQNVWANLEKSLENTDATGWERNISQQEFLYEPDDQAREQFPGVYAQPWDLPREIAFIGNFYNSGVTISAQLRNDDFEVPGTSGGESLWEDVIYDITVTNDVDGSSVRYRGRADIYFRLEGNFWYVYRWIDNGGESPPEGGASLQTMGVIRGTFASNR